MVEGVWTWCDIRESNKSNRTEFRHSPPPEVDIEVLQLGRGTKLQWCRGSKAGRTNRLNRFLIQKTNVFSDSFSFLLFRAFQCCPVSKNHPPHGRGPTVRVGGPAEEVSAVLRDLRRLPQGHHAAAAWQWVLGFDGRRNHCHCFENWHLLTYSGPCCILSPMDASPSPKTRVERHGL